MALTAKQNDTVVLNGILLQNFDSIGINQLDGRGGLPAPVYASEQRVQANGSWVTKAYDTSMSFTLGGWVSGLTVARRDHFLSIVRGAAATYDCPLTFPFNNSFVTYTVRRTSEFNVTFLNDNTAFWSFTVTAFNPAGRLGGQKITYYGESSGFHRYAPKKRKPYPTYSTRRKAYAPMKRRPTPNYTVSRSAYRPQKRKPSPGYSSHTSTYRPQKRTPTPGYVDHNSTYAPAKRTPHPQYDDGRNNYRPIHLQGVSAVYVSAPNYNPSKGVTAPYYDDGNNTYAPDPASNAPLYNTGNPSYTPYYPTVALVDAGDQGYTTSSTVDAALWDAGDWGTNAGDLLSVPLDDPGNPGIDTVDDVILPVDTSNGAPDYGSDTDNSDVYYDLQFPDGFFDGLDMDENDSLITATTSWTSGPAADAFRFPFSFSNTGKMTFGSMAKQKGSITLTVPTNAANLRFQIKGACTNPTITTILPDGTLYLLAWNYLTMDANSTLTVDVPQHVAVLNDTAPRPPSNRDWPSVEGGDVVFVFNADSASTSTQFTVYMEPLI